MDTLIFIDTNILLDFYRIPSGGTGLSLLKHIDDNRHMIITGNQIEMEYRKNRQRVILESLGRIKTPDWAGLTSPAFLSEAQPSRAIDKSKKELVKQQKTLKRRIEAVLRNPPRNDPVYKVLQRLFKENGEYNLNRRKKVRYKIRSLAWKRFILGYPPRKKNDTSMGDAVNWEWIIRCAIDSGKDIIIASRDSDYGVTYAEESILNDYLAQEFRERVSRRRRIDLTDKLAHAFKLASISVTKKEERDELNLIEELSDEEKLLKRRFRATLDALLCEIENIKKRADSPLPSDFGNISK